MVGSQDGRGRGPRTQRAGGAQGGRRTNEGQAAEKALLVQLSEHLESTYLKGGAAAVRDARRQSGGKAFDTSARWHQGVRAIGGSWSARMRSKPFSEMPPSLLPPLFAEEWGDCARRCSASFLLATDVTCDSASGVGCAGGAGRAMGAAKWRH